MTCSENIEEKIGIKAGYTLLALCFALNQAKTWRRYFGSEPYLHFFDTEVRKTNFQLFYSVVKKMITQRKSHKKWPSHLCAPGNSKPVGFIETQTLKKFWLDIWELHKVRLVTQTTTRHLLFRLLNLEFAKNLRMRNNLEKNLAQVWQLHQSKKRTDLRNPEMTEFTEKKTYVFYCLCQKIELAIFQQRNFSVWNGSWNSLWTIRTKLFVYLRCEEKSHFYSLFPTKKLKLNFFRR